MSPVLVITGPPGAGKTTAGRLLAEALGCDFVDTDAEVERLAGSPVRDIFVEHGEARFRELERDAVLAALTGSDGVVALGGGAVMTAGVPEALTGHRVAFLDVDIADAAKRVGFNRDRPLLLGNPRASWLRLMETRRPVYERLATFTVATDGRTPDEVVEALRKELGR